MPPVDPTFVRDVVIVIPGIMGSALVDADDRPLWSVGPGSLVRTITSLGGSLRRLTLPDDIRDEAPGDGVKPAGLLPSLHVIPGLWSPITGYDGLLAFLGGRRFQLLGEDARDPDRRPNLLAFPYDWRLSNRYNGRRLKTFATGALERWRDQPGMRDAKLVLICHSMGGLVARWFLEREGGREITRTLVTIGTPHRGALRALDTLANGLRPGLGPLRVDLSAFARSLPSLHQLLPTYDCIVMADGKRRGLRGLDVPNIATRMLGDAMQFHADLDASTSLPYKMHKIVGTRQPTLTTATITGRVVATSEAIDGRYQGGDGTVPHLSAEPFFNHGVDAHEAAEQHGELQATRSALDLIDGIMTREEIIWQAAPAETLAVRMDDIWNTAESPQLEVTEGQDARLTATVIDESDQIIVPPMVIPKSGVVQLDPLPPGGYRARVAAAKAGGPSPVTHPFLVWDAQAVSASGSERG